MDVAHHVERKSLIAGNYLQLNKITSIQLVYISQVTANAAMMLLNHQILQH